MQKVYIILSILILVAPGWTATLNVPDQYESIQSAIDAAVDFDTVLVAPGYYLQEGNESIRFRGKSIHLGSEAGPGETFLLTVESERTFIFDQNVDTNAIIEGFTITTIYSQGFHGAGPYRGGVLINAGSPVFKHCIFTGCYSNHGGAVEAYGGNPRFINCEFTGNIALINGGAALIESDSAQFIDCTISNNLVFGAYPTSGLFGGGLVLVNGTYILRGCTIADNSSAIDRGILWGGGICSFGADVRIDGTTIAHNTADFGGACFAFTGSLAMTNSVIYNNLAQRFAGVVMDRVGIPMGIAVNAKNNTFVCNYAADTTGDGIAIIDTLGITFGIPFELTQKDGNAGVSMAPPNDDINIIDNIFAFNAATPVFNEILDISVWIEHNDVWATVSGPDYGGILADQTGINGNISVDPLFCEISDTGLTLDITSQCLTASSTGSYIGALGQGCDLYQGGSPKTVQLTVDHYIYPPDLQDSLDAAVASANPWDTLHLQYSTSLEIIRFEVDKSLYVIGSGISQHRVLTRTEYWTDDWTGSTVCVDIKSFCEVSNIYVEAMDLGNSGVNISAAVRINNCPAIVKDCKVVGTSGQGYALETGLASTGGSFLVRYCEVYGGNYALYNVGAEPIMASYNHLLADWSYDLDEGIWDFYDDSASGRVYYLPTLDNAPTDVEDNPPTVPATGLILKQNSPNPFNGSTTITFYQPRHGHVTLDIFNILGQKVRTLIDGDASAGWQQIFWDGCDNAGKTVASGVYIYRVQAGQFTQKRNMIFLK